MSISKHLDKCKWLSREFQVATHQTRQLSPACPGSPTTSLLLLRYLEAYLISHAMFPFMLQYVSFKNVTVRLVDRAQ